MYCIACAKHIAFAGHYYRIWPNNLLRTIVGILKKHNFYFNNCFHFIENLKLTNYVSHETIRAIYGHGLQIRVIGVYLQSETSGNFLNI